MVRRLWADIQIQNASWHPKLNQRVKYLFSKVNRHRFNHADFYTRTLALTSKFWDLSEFCVSKATVCRSEAEWGQDVSVPILCSSLDLWVFLPLCLGYKNLLVRGGEVRNAKSSLYFWRKIKTHKHKHSVVWLHGSVVPPKKKPHPTNEDPHLARGGSSHSGAPMKPTAGESWTTCLALTPPHHRVAVARSFRHRLLTKYGEEDDGRQETVYTAVHATVQPTSSLSLAPVFLQSQQRRGGHWLLKWSGRDVSNASWELELSKPWVAVGFFLLLFRGCGGWDSRGIAYYDLGFACVYVILEWWSSGGAQTWGTRRSKWHSFFFCGVWFLE